MAIIWFVLLAPEMQHHSAMVRPPALHRQQRAAGSKQFLIARPAQLFPVFQKWHCSSRGATAGPVHRRGSLCCHAGLLGAENVAACLSSLSSELPRGLVGHGAVLTQLHCCRFLSWPWMGVPVLRSIAECSYACSDFLQVVTKVFNSLQCK